MDLDPPVLKARTQPRKCAPQVLRAGREEVRLIATRTNGEGRAYRGPTHLHRRPLHSRPYPSFSFSPSTSPPFCSSHSHSHPFPLALQGINRLGLIFQQLSIGSLAVTTVTIMEAAEM